MKQDRISKLADDAIEFADMQEHLSTCRNDLILITLKGHLVVEHLIGILLIRELNIPKLPKFGFAKKLELMSVIVCSREPGPKADLLLVVKELNVLRNDLAHNLRSPREIEFLVDKFIDDYYTRVGKKRHQTNKLSLAEELRVCLIKLAQFAFSYRVHFHKLDSRGL